MNSTRISKLILSLLFLCLATTGRAQTFPRLLLSGDYPDPSIIREGKDFYMTNSSFNYAPGLLIWHSTDLVNWQQTGHVFDEKPEWTKSSFWAPEWLIERIELTAAREIIVKFRFAALQQTG